MMNLSVLEKEVFREKSKDQLIQDALANCQAIVADAFSDDINDLRSDFPPGTEQEDIKVNFQSLRLNIAHHTQEVPSVEIIITMETPDQTPIGYYMMIFDKSLNIIDEHFVVD